MLLSEEVQGKALQFTYKGVAITAKVIHDLIMRYSMRSEIQTYGKQSIKKLNRKNRALENIPIAGMDLRGMQRELRRYGVDYAVTARNAEPGTYDIYFKGGDISQIQTALRTYAWNSFHRSQRPMIKDRMRSAVEKAQQQTPAIPGQHPVIARPQEVR